MKTLPAALDKQLLEIVRQGFKDALPSAKNRWRRNGNGLPLTSWMKGAPAKCESKIIAVDECKARYPYTQTGAGAKVVAERIAKRFKTTWIQHSLIEDHVLKFYRGANSSFYSYRQSEYIDEFGPDNTSHVTSDAFWMVCGKLRKQPHDLPLRVLIDARVTNLLLLMELTERTKRARKANNNGRTATYDIR